MNYEVKRRLFSMFIITLELFEGEDLAAILRVLSLSTLSSIAPSGALIQEETHNLSLVNVAMVRVDLNEGLDLIQGVLGKTIAIDTSDHFEEIITIDYALINLLIILLQFGEHFVSLLFEKTLKAVKCGRINQSNKLLSHLRLTVKKLLNLQLSLVLLGYFLIVDLLLANPLLINFVLLLVVVLVVIVVLLRLSLHIPGCRRSKVCHKGLQIDQLDGIR